MPWDALGAIGSFGQFIVVSVAAFFAVQQIVLLRRQNELQATLPYFAYTRTPEFNAAFIIVRTEMLTGPRDPGLARAIADGTLEDQRVLAIFNLANFFNELGVLVQERMIDEDTTLGFFRWQIVATWDLFAPFVASRRASGASGLMTNLEALAVRARAYDMSKRYDRARRTLPESLRGAFDASVAATRAMSATAPESSGTARDDSRRDPVSEP